MNREIAQRILIIEADPDVREMLRDYLKIKGYTVDCTGNGADGISMHIEKSFDLIITNLMLSDVEGSEILVKLRQLSDTKIIATSCLVGGLEMAGRMGADRTFAMPLNVRELEQAAVELLAEK
ncbi:MAG: response regulator [Candidatus Aminicenantes bacterium]|nr:response regulator [Candidatus Aminicenantes bacterium]